jgi:GTP-binding protein LepA
MALDHNLEILPVINKIDLPSAEPERVRAEIEEVIGIDASLAILASAKENIGTEDILEGIVQHFPPPKGDAAAPLRALIIDCWFDPYHGAVVMMRLFDGAIKKGTKIRMMASGRAFEVLRLGVFSPGPTEVDELRAGEVGFLMAGIKEVAETQIGDTITSDERPVAAPLPGFKPMKPMVFSGLYPTDSGQYQAMREALEKLRLNDSSFTYEPETSQALGFGFRCGFLGLLHMDIVRERLEREFALSLITTAATVVYRIITVTGETLMIDNPVRLPNESAIDRIEEPVIQATLHLPQEFLGGVMKICEEKRGAQKEIRYLGPKRAMLVYELPLNEIVVDFYDRLKSVSRGYASMDYEMAGYRAADLVKLDVRINGDLVDAMSMIVHRDKAYYRGRDLVQKMRELIPRQMFEVVIQAAIGSRIISRESVKPLRKNVTAKCYGGDITRKRKLLERQKEGKKRMKQVGKVEIPQEAFLAALKV